MDINPAGLRAFSIRKEWQLNTNPITAKVFVDGFFLDNGRGMARFNERFMEPLEGDQLCICRPEGWMRWISNKNFHPLWEQIILPFKLLISGKANDILLSGYNTAPLWLPAKIKRVQVVHDAIFMASAQELPYKKNLLREIPRFYRRFIVPRTVHRAVSIVTVSKYSRDVICQNFGLDPTRIEVLYNSVGDALFSRTPLARSERENYIFTISGDTPSKNLEATFLIFSSLLAKGGVAPDLRLKIGGIPAAAHESVRQRLTSAGASAVERVDFLPRLDDEALFEVYRYACAYLCTSLQEGFGVPLIEAMACGTPVISTNTTAMPEVVGDAGLLFSPDDLPAGESHLRRVLTDEAVWEDLQARGLQRAEAFRSGTILQQMSNFWRKLGVQVQGAASAI